MTLGIRYWHSILAFDIDEGYYDGYCDVFCEVARSRCKVSMKNFDYHAARAREDSQKQDEDYGPSKRLDDEANSVLKHLTQDDWKRLLDFATAQRFEPKETLIKVGDKDDAVFILAEGEVQVVVKHPFFGQRVLAVIPEGSVFGEMAFFERRPRSATIQAISKGLVLRITRQDFERLFAEEPFLARQLLFDFGKVLSMRNRFMASLIAAR